MNEPTMKEVLELVDFYPDANGQWRVLNVNGYVMNSVRGNVGGTVKGTINGRRWQYAETIAEQLIRLIREGKSEEAINIIQEWD